MSDSWTLRARGISKKFGLTLSQSMKYGLKDVIRKLLGKPVDTARLREGEFWAVRDVGFELKPGEAMGIMGVNGSGKTTLLRILNGVYPPDAGFVTLRGRVGALIAAGAGFAPMLSGRENIFVNGSLMGMTNREMSSVLDEIVSFAELDKFIDLPVKNYSTGMFIRLGFAVAAFSRPDILLMDEVLAVGDLNFQKKCFEHILRLKNKGTSIVLVSHSPGSIWSVCDSGIMMDKGRVIVHGDIESVIRAYDDQNSLNAFEANKRAILSSLTDKTLISQECDVETDVSASSLPGSYGHSRGGTGDAICRSVRVLETESLRPTDKVKFADSFALEFVYLVNKKIDQPIFRASIDAVHYKFLVSIDSLENGFSPSAIDPGKYVLRVSVLKLSLRPGVYSINTSLTSRRLGIHIFYWMAATSFVVMHPENLFLYSNDKAIFFSPCEFILERLD